jgi:hypothetical protein
MSSSGADVRHVAVLGSLSPQRDHRLGHRGHIQLGGDTEGQGMAQPLGAPSMASTPSGRDPPTALINSPVTCTSISPRSLSPSNTLAPAITNSVI